MKAYAILMHALGGLWVIAFVVVIVADLPTKGTVFYNIGYDPSGFIHELAYMFGGMMGSFLALDWLHEKVVK